ncbi:CaiB/BaiF CoA-transferase family protein [Nocardioides sp. zg-DK7169]|uniref:CaiB/BaiF CoA transferase family protein n=1 Tax=Nocardioides sp. zg-DK7169 TaxID=2736600 RepID=UPI0015529464|nr:CoA transferase [Nocardioides sp. zg-DK7169]NPC96585.1 CoA transferase [Nocardioides sp. zg-DK7169]
MTSRETADSTAPRTGADALPLAGVRVVELGNYIAAPTAARMLADFGAEVIKVERPRTGDELRNWRLYAGDTSMLYRTINRGKRSIELDLRSEQGRETVLDLVAVSDVLIENFRPGTLDAWGLGADVLAARNPELVVSRISAFGQTGPMSQRPGFAAVAEAYGGMRELVGESDRPPSRVGVSIGDSIAGLYAAFGVVMSLFDRDRRRGRGDRAWAPTERQVDVALHEAVFSMMESLLPDYSAHGVLRARAGGRMEGIAPSNAYTCAGGESVVIAGNGDSIYGRFMEAIGRPDLATQPDLVTNAGRWARRDEIDDAINAWTGARDRAEVLRVLDAAGVPAGPIYTAEDIVEDEQYLARDMVQHLPVDVAGSTVEVAFPGIVPLLGERSVPVSAPGPDLGADTHAVVVDLLGRSSCPCRDCAAAASAAEAGQERVAPRG